MKPKRLFFGALPLLFSLFFATKIKAQELPPVQLQDFSQGWVTKFDSSDICETCAQDLDNVDIQNGYIAKRRGSIKTNVSGSVCSAFNQPIRFQHEYVDPNSNRWLIFVTSNSVCGSKDGGAVQQVLTSGLGVTSSSRFSAINAFGKAYLVDGSTNALVFDGSTIVASTSIPKGTTIEFFGERLVVGGVSGSQGTLYTSAVGNASDWTQDSGLDTDAFSQNIRQQSGYPIRCVKRWRNGVLIFQDRSIDLLTLSGDGLTFILTPVSSRIGTTFPETVVSFDNVARWISYDGVYEYNGALIKRISEPIQPTIESIAQLSSLGRSANDTTFTQGTSTGTSATIESGALHISTWGATDTSSSDFGAGTLTNVTTSTLDGFVYLSQTNTSTAAFNWNFDIDSSVSCCTTNPSSWTRLEGAVSGLDNNNPRSSPNNLSILTGSPFTAFNVLILSTANVVIADLGNDLSSFTGSYSQISKDLSAVAGRYGKISFKATGGSTQWQASNTTVFFSSGPLTYWVLDLGTAHTNISIDDIGGGSTTITNGTFTSQTFNTGLNRPLYSLVDVNTTLNGHQNDIRIQTSTDGVTFTSYGSGVALSALNPDRYIRYIVEFTLLTTGTGRPFLSDATLSARNRSGAYWGAYNALTGFSSWGPFIAEEALNSGVITYGIYVDSDTTRTITNENVDMTTVVSSQTITSGTIPTLTATSSSYTFFGSTFAISSASYDPTLYDATINWNEGNPSLIPSCTIWDLDLYCAVAFNSSTVNDNIIIYDKNTAWSKYSGLPAYYLSSYNNLPLFGSNEDGNLVRFQVANRYRDYDDGAISAYFVSKDYDLGSPLTKKTLLRHYLTTKYQTGSNLTFEYGVNRPTTYASTSHVLSTFSGFYRSSIQPSSLTFSEGLQHRWKISDSTLNGRFEVLGITMRFNLLTPP